MLRLLTMLLARAIQSVRRVFFFYLSYALHAQATLSTMRLRFRRRLACPGQPCPDLHGCRHSEQSRSSPAHHYAPDLRFRFLRFRKAAPFDRYAREGQELRAVSTAGDRSQFVRQLAAQGWSESAIASAVRASSERVRQLLAPGQDSASHASETGGSTAEDIGRATLDRFAKHNAEQQAEAQHAGQPNAQLVIAANGDLHEVALRDIVAGEEITNDYRRNARVFYSALTGRPIEEVTRAMVRDAMLAAPALLARA